MKTIARLALVTALTFLVASYVQARPTKPATGGLCPCTLCC